MLTDEPGTEVTPGVTVHAMDIGAWFNRRREHTTWSSLTDGQRELLDELGITSLPHKAQTPAGATVAVSAFERGVQALTQYQARTGSLTVPRSHVETLPDGRTDVRLGVFLSNSKTRRAKLTPDKLAALGLNGAAPGT